MTDKPLDTRSTLYTEFHQGFLLAADSMKRAGMSLNIYAIDTRGNHQYVKSQLDLLADKDLDLIIGPVEDDDISSVAQFAKKHDINMVNPFSRKKYRSRTQ